MTNLPSACSKASTTLNVTGPVANGPRPPPQLRKGPAIRSFRFLGRLFPGRSTGVKVVDVAKTGGVGLTLPPRPDNTLPPPPPGKTTTIRLSGNVPAELWNRLGTRVLPKLKTGKDLKIGIDFSVTVEWANANDLKAELTQILADLGLQGSVSLDET
jgi:hypothetical protein